MLIRYISLIINNIIKTLMQGRTSKNGKHGSVKQLARKATKAKKNTDKMSVTQKLRTNSKGN